ncbi:hypothetical protein Taro_046924 [Colocasia esculenta]|uniref:RRM domain-containing protein n=1 Tax=Colocasia esculenta TaxID=4460 RepID=A0A843WZU6_COLES|nr:hypothetical protein [Colocasia esculenta]
MAYQQPPLPGSSAPGSGSSSASRLPFLNSPFGDTTYTKVFVGGLAWETQSETMRQYFEQFGEILEAVVITDKNTGRSKGYGFVTFRDPESALRACADPSPVIDGRRANCNLASLGRPRLPPTYARVRVGGPYFGGVPAPRGAYVGSSGYHQPIPYSYQQGFAYPSYGYATYGPEYIYPQNVYNPFTGQQYVQVYSVPGTVNPSVYSLGQVAQPLPSGHGYTAVQGYAVPTHHIVQLSTPNVNGVTAAPIPAIQAPYPAEGLRAEVLPFEWHALILPCKLLIFAFLGGVSVVIVAGDNHKQSHVRLLRPVGAKAREQGLLMCHCV